MPRFYCPDFDVASTVVALDEAQAAHARRVLRLQPGDAVELFDGRGRVAIGTVASLQGRVLIEITRTLTVPPLKPTLELAVALPKAGRADDMVNQLVQLGVDRLLPLRTARGTVDPRDAKIERFERIVIEACKQCGRADLMTIDGPTELAAALQIDPGASGRGGDLRLVAALNVPSGLAAARATPAVLDERLTAAARVRVFIGPEGGWTDAELKQLIAGGCLTWQLGPHTLRIATAAAAAAAIVRHCAG
jgi:16S rRNA (uracil1498-N3)-methyltransferase